MGHAARLTQTLSGWLGQDLARLEVEALPQVRPWRSALRPELVWTGFAPFGPHASNPSGLAARQAALVTAGVGHAPLWQTSAHELDVTYQVAADFTQRLDAIEPERPVVVMHLGLAARRTQVCVEEFAHNVCAGQLDNAQEAGPRSGYLKLDGPLARRTTWPADDLVRRWPALHPDWPQAGLTRDPGDYICNAILYHTLGWFERREQPGGALFVHLPELDDAQAERVGQALGLATAQLLHELLDA